MKLDDGISFDAPPFRGCGCRGCRSRCSGG